MIGIGATLFKVPTAYGPAGFSPKSLFSNGEEGAWYDPSDLSTLFQEDGTTAAGVGDPVGKILDKSGNDNHLVQTTQTKCPILRQDGSLYYLDFDGTDDGLRTSSSIDFTGTDAMSVFAGAQKTVTGANQNVVELSDSVNANNGAFRLFYVNTDVWRSIMKGTTINAISTSSVSNPDKSIFSVTADISDPSHSFRRNGSSVGSNTSSLGTGNFGNHNLNMGSRSDGASSVLDGDVYGLIVLGRKATDGEIASVEKYMASKSGVSI